MVNRRRAEYFARRSSIGDTFAVPRAFIPHVADLGERIFRDRPPQQVLGPVMIGYEGVLETNTHRDIPDTRSLEPAFGEFGKGGVEDHLPGFDRALLFSALRCSSRSPLSANVGSRGITPNGCFS